MKTVESITHDGAAAPDPAELGQLDPPAPPKSPKGDFSPPVPQGSGGIPLTSRIPIAHHKMIYITANPDRSN